MFLLKRLLLLSVLFLSLGQIVNAQSSVNGNGVIAVAPPAPAPLVCLSPGTLAFGNVTNGTTSNPLTETITNCGNANLILNATYFTITGTNAAQFSNTGAGTCSNNLTITPGGNCTITVTFSPNAVASFSAILNVQDNAADSPESASLTGTGVSAGSGTATPMLTPNGNTVFGTLLASSTSNPASTSTPTLTFGSQGRLTSSPALTMLVTNASGVNLTVNSGTQLWNGSGSLTLSNPYAALSGTNSADWSISGGSCANGTILNVGQSCTITLVFTPSASTGTAETAVLTVNDNGTTSSQTMNLTGTSATVTSVSGCQTLNSASTVYQLTQNVSGTQSCFPVQASSISLNLNGHTLTYGSSHTTLCVFGVFGASSTDLSSNCANGNSTGGSWNNLSVYNGTITEGDCLNPNDVHIGSSAVMSGGSSGTGISVFNTTFNTCSEGASAIYDLNGFGTGWSLHDNTINSRVVTAAKRSIFEGVAIVCDGCGGDSGTAPIIFNNYITGGPQGAVYFNSGAGTQLYNNYGKTGNGGATPGFLNGGTGSLVCGGANANPYTNAAGTTPSNAGTECSNDFVFYAAHKNANIHDNYAAPNGSRGLFIGNAVSGEVMSYNVTNPVAPMAKNNSEYQGCEIGSAFAAQFDNQPTNGTFSHNTVTGLANTCAAIGFRSTDSETYTNVSQNNVYTVSRTTNSPATPCPTSGATSSIYNAACAIGFSMQGASLLGCSTCNTKIKSINDTFTADTYDIWMDYDGCNPHGSCSPADVMPIFQSPTFNKGTAFPDPNFHFALFSNAGTDHVHVIDATFGTGVSPTDVLIQAQSNGFGAASLYIDWTQTYTVQQSSNSAPINGATVTLTDSHGNAYACTTNSSGVCAPLTTVLTSGLATPPVQYRNNNDTGANQLDNGYNPYTLQIVKSGCTTLNQNSITISATASITKQLAGC